MPETIIFFFLAATRSIALFLIPLVIINFKFTHKSIKELNNFEEALDKINIITEYSILEHDKEKTTFKIAYLGNPKRLSQEFLDLHYELVDMQGSWAIKKK